MSPFLTQHERDISASAPPYSFKHTNTMFETLFERSADPIWLYDPQTIMLLDCNQAAVNLLGAPSKQQLLLTRPEEISPEMQPDGSLSAEKAAEIVSIVERQKAHRFEWVVRRFDGRNVPVEVSSTAMPIDGKSIHVIISRDISERKKAERELLEMTHALERRVTERTSELTTSEARFRALVEHAPDAIVVFDGDTGRFLFGNEHACRLYGVPMESLAKMAPIDVSPEFQPCGRHSGKLAREKMDEALAGGKPVFEWIHRKPDGRLVPTEVRLLRLPAEGQNLIRASIMDNTERKRAERALRESEEKFRALFEGSSQGVVLHDESEILELNPAALRILGFQSADEVVGRHPQAFSPPFQPNGEPTDVMIRKYLDRCLRQGSIRFEWLALAADGRNIPLEVALMRIDWSGRQIFQAVITDISERKRGELALLEANRELQREVEQRTRAEEALKERVRMSTLNAEVALSLNAGDEIQPMLQRCCELMVQHLDVAFARIWVLHPGTQILELQASAGCYTHLNGSHSRLKVGQFKIGTIAQEKKPLLTNTVLSDSRISDPEWAAREGMVAFAGYPLLIEDRVLGVLGMFSRRPLPPDALTPLGCMADSIALGIERKRAQTALTESEARCSTAFQASPALIGVLRMSDRAYILANDSFLNWLGFRLEDVLGRTCDDLGVWENQEEHDQVIRDISASGSIRQRECRWRNRRGDSFTMLLSVETIKVNNSPHLLTMAMDITQRKRAEEELLKTLEREKELGQLKSNFVSMVSHEFRTPLGIIQSSGELLLDFYQQMQPSERDEQVASIIRNTRRMASMMEGVLVLSRLDAGKLICQPVSLDLNVFCRRVVDEVLSATNRRCLIQLSLNSVPSDAKADEQLLGHIFTNLLSNAVKYSDEGALVNFAVEKDGPDAVCVVRDRGIGISEEDQQQLFIAFHRGRNVGSRPGTGLGLLLVKRCAELHGGKVHIKSKTGEGTTVTVRLPVFRVNHEKNTGH